jgi:CheY-like chemotaxis protein
MVIGIAGAHPIVRAYSRMMLRGATPTVDQMNEKAETYLLVDDDENDIFFMEQSFRQTATRFEAVRDGAEAVDYLTRKGKYKDHERYPLPTMILLDIKMPRMNGFEFLEWLRNESPADLKLLPVVMMTSSAFDSDVNRAYKLGANAYMVKPINIDQFQERIKCLDQFWSNHAEKPRVGHI